MYRLIASELASIGRRLSGELQVAYLSPSIRDALDRLNTKEATAHIRSGPNALRINGYV